MKSLSVLCYVVAGFFVYGVGLMAFVDVSHLLTFGDVTSGMGCILLFTLLGVLLIWSSDRPGKPVDSPRNERLDDNPYSPPMHYNS